MESSKPCSLNLKRLSTEDFLEATDLFSGDSTPRLKSDDIQQEGSGRYSQRSLSQSSLPTLDSPASFTLLPTISRGTSGSSIASFSDQDFSFLASDLQSFVNEAEREISLLNGQGAHSQKHTLLGTSERVAPQYRYDHLEIPFEVFDSGMERTLSGSSSEDTGSTFEQDYSVDSDAKRQTITVPSSSTASEVESKTRTARKSSASYTTKRGKTSRTKSARALRLNAAKGKANPPQNKRSKPITKRVNLKAMTAKQRLEYKKKKKEERMQKNRESANRSRIRKKKEQKELLETLANLKTSVKGLNAKLAAVQAENAKLRNALGQGADKYPVIDVNNYDPVEEFMELDNKETDGNISQAQAPLKMFAITFAVSLFTLNALGGVGSDSILVDSVGEASRAVANTDHTFSFASVPLFKALAGISGSEPSYMPSILMFAVQIALSAVLSLFIVFAATAFQRRKKHSPASVDRLHDASGIFHERALTVASV